MTEPDERSPEYKAYYEEFWRLRDKVILLSLRAAEFFYDPQTRGYDTDATADEVQQAYHASDDELETAVREWALYMLKPVPE